MPDFVEVWARFRIDIWAWNVAMQVSLDDEVRRMMQQRLQAPLWEPNLLERAMMARFLQHYHPTHTDTYRQWNLLVTDEIETIDDFLAVGPAIQPEGPEDPNQ
jgi:hypothetical protein